MTIKYISCEKPGQFISGNKPMPVPGPKEVLVKIKHLGVCGTDLHAFAGNQAYFKYPRILGHEIAAEILEGNGNFIEGEKVSILPYLNCGQCMACEVGKTNCCAQLKVLGVHVDGAMQEVMAIPQDFLLATPSLSWEEIAIIEPLSVASHAVKRAGIKKGEQVLVMGCGPIGLAIIVFAKLAGAEVCALDLNTWRLDLSKQQFGADHLIDASQFQNDSHSYARHFDRFHVVFDATGNKNAMESGPKYLCHGGRYVLVGLYKSDLVFNHPAIHAKEMSLLCSRNATISDFQFVIKTLAENLFPTDAYITHKVGFEDTIDRFPEWTSAENNVVKAMLNF